jgi:hypothetical protein
MHWQFHRAVFNPPLPRYSGMRMLREINGRHGWIWYSHCKNLAGQILFERIWRIFEAKFPKRWLDYKLDVARIPKLRSNQLQVWLTCLLNVSGDKLNTVFRAQQHSPTASDKSKISFNNGRQYSSNARSALCKCKKHQRSVFDTLNTRVGKSD